MNHVGVFRASKRAGAHDLGSSVCGRDSRSLETTGARERAAGPWRVTLDGTDAPERPLSPHIQIYRWPLPMTMSILHRITGAGLYFGTLLMVWWLIAAGGGPNAYSKVGAFTSSLFGRLILFGYTWALIHHMLGGIRHLIWDTGRGFGPYERDALA